MQKLPNPKPSIRTRKCNLVLKTCWINVCTITTVVVVGIWTPNFPNSCCPRFHQQSFCAFQPVFGDLSALSGSSQQQQDWFVTTHCCFHFYFLSGGFLLGSKLLFRTNSPFPQTGWYLCLSFCCYETSSGLIICSLSNLGWFSSKYLRVASDFLCSLAVFSWLMASSCCSYCSSSSQLLFHHF